jgi:recombination protein RecT
MAQTVRAEVAEREEEKREVNVAEARVRKARDWFATVVPSHVNPDQYIAIVLGALRKNPDLMAAAVANPGSLMQAASECARLGLVPGDTFHFVAYRDRAKGGPPVITGIVDYRGEIDMIYRAGGVLSVHAQVVRKNDQFAWRPNVMTLPMHEIGGDQAQPGLGSQADRGPLTGAYAYARMRDGGYSEPIVMGRSEIRKHWAVAKTKKFWGEWPEDGDPVEGPWTPDMWLKTVLHKLYDRVPHSQEYMAERLRAVSAGDPPLHLVHGGAAALPAPVTPPDTTEGNGGPPAEDQADIGPVAEDDPAERTRGMRHVHAMFREAGLSGAEHAAQRRAVLSVLIRDTPADDPVRLTSTAEMTGPQLHRARAKLQAIMDGTKDNPAQRTSGFIQLAQLGGWKPPEAEAPADGG